MKRNILWIILTFLLVASQTMMAATITLQGAAVTDDKMLYNYSADSVGVRIWSSTTASNFYNVINPYSTYYTYQSFLKFDLSGIASNAVITSATLGLYKEGFYNTTATSINFYIYQVMQNWDEVTNNFFPAINSVAVASTVSSATVGYVTFDIKNLVQSWVNGTAANYGIRPEQDYTSANQHTGFTSSDASTNMPYLTITYTTTVPEPSSLLLAMVGLSILLYRKIR